MRALFVLLFAFSFYSSLTKAQNIALKTNVVTDLTGTINLGAELITNEQWTVNLSGNLNKWNHSHGRRWKHWVVQPEVRYWLCESFGGHFVGLHLQGGMYNIGNLKNGIHFLGTDFSKISHGRYQGWLLGGGIAYGYDWILSKHWNLETEIGIGYNFTKSDRYPCATCGQKLESGTVHHYFGPTKIALNIVYIW